MVANESLEFMRENLLRHEMAEQFYSSIITGDIIGIAWSPQSIPMGKYPYS